MPIEEEFRFWESSARVYGGGPSEWNITDCDQRRLITVKMDGEQEESEHPLNYIKAYIDSFGPDVTMVHISPDGKLISASSDPELDQTWCVYYPPLHLIRRPAGVKTVLRSELRELDRLAAHVDLVSYQTDTGTRKAVFKYYWQWQFIGRNWDELNLWMRLTPHPNIVPFDRIVLDEVNGDVVGFTSQYIPGGTLKENYTRTFKLKWCKQLIQLADELNLHYGIAHQDISPRNLLVDEATDNIMLFDFNYSAQIGRHRGTTFFWYRDTHDDVRGVVFTVYEMITRDFHFRETPSENLDLSLVRDIEWVPDPSVTLDQPITEYRALLDAWLETRERKKVTVYTDAPECIDWPALDMQPSFSTPYRRDARAQGIPTVEWQRPVQSSLKDDYYLLANGQLLGPDPPAAA